MDFIAWNEYYESWFGGDVGALRRNLEAIHAAFPDKPVVISEYGYCACTADRPEDDRRRAEILRTHNAVFREFPWIAGLIFFDYNDYRTHIGDKGVGPLKQRVHGVVDVLGARKPSFEELRRESSPVESLETKTAGRGLVAVVRARKDLPAYTLRGYTLRWTAYGRGDIPLERSEVRLADLSPGTASEVRIAASLPDILKVVVEIVRPTGFAAAAATYVPKR
jgi:beta-glucuronidase